MKIQTMGNAMSKKSLALVFLAGLFLAPQAANPLMGEIDEQNALQKRWDRLVARAGLEFGMVAEGEYFKSVVDGSLSDPDKETSDKKQSTMVDLRIGARPWSALGGDVVIRFQQDWQTYFSNRSRPIHLRWIQMHGKVGNSLAYAVGDFKEKWSPLTLWSPELSILMEAPIFARARQEAMQEEFLGDNNRVLQGAKVNSAFTFGKAFEWRVDGYASRIRRAEYLDGVQPSLDASKHPIFVVGKHGSEFGIASDLEQWSVGANTELLVLRNAFVGASLINTFEDPQTWRPSDNQLKADSGYSLNGQNWYLDNLWATDNKVVSFRVGLDAAGFLRFKGVTAQAVAEYALSGLSYDWLPPANQSTSVRLTGADKAAVTELQNQFRTQIDSLVYESHTGIGAFADTIWTAHYTLDGIDPIDEKEGAALLIDADFGWTKGKGGLALELGFRYLDVDSSFYNLLAQSPTFRAERVMNSENDLSLAGVAAPLYSTFDAVYHTRAKVSPLRNQPYHQAPYVQNAYTNSIGTSSFVADPNVQLLLPFGYSTPNRKGVDLDATIAFGKKFKIQGLFSKLDEKVVESSRGLSDLTAYTQMGGGAMVDIGAFIGLDRAIQLSGGYQLSTADYDQDIFSTTMINGGLSVDLMRKIALLGGYQRFDASYDKAPDLKLQQQWRAGLQYRLKDNSYIVMSVGQIFVDQESQKYDEAGAPVSFDKDDFTQFLTQIKVRAEF